jgi:hypothetical protein
MRIITHNGPKAHADEVLAIAILLGMVQPDLTKVRIERRPRVSEAHLDDEDTWVLDIGHRHEPESKNFDHHGEDQEDLPCTLHLVARHFGLEEALQGAFPWYEYKNVLDTQGPRAAARAVGVTGNTRPLMSPVEGWLLSRFADSDGVIRDRILVRVLRDMGRSLVERAHEFERKIDELKRESEVWTRELSYIKADGDELSITVLSAPDLVADGAVIRAYRDRYEREHGKAFTVTITKDPRGGGTSLYRYEDAVVDAFGEDPEQLDFTDLRGRGITRFVHNSGFLATFKDEEDARLGLFASIQEAYNRSLQRKSA